MEALFFFVAGLTLPALFLAIVSGYSAWTIIPLFLGALACCYSRKWALAFTLFVTAIGVFVFANRSSCRESQSGFSATQVTGGTHQDGFPYNQSYNDKPVIYLYPQHTQSVTVRLSVKNGMLSATHPEFDTSIGGWKVTATSDGRLTDARDGREYSYLFWESAQTSATPYDLSKGFVVKGSEVRSFLSKILPEAGLTPREYNEFIVYWYPRLMNIPLMQIYFAGEEYTDSAPLSIEPEPDSILRLFMVVRPLKEPLTLTPQKLPTFERKGFSVVEWGGTLLP